MVRKVNTIVYVRVAHELQQSAFAEILNISIGVLDKHKCCCYKYNLSKNFLIFKWKKCDLSIYFIVSFIIN